VGGDKFPIERLRGIDGVNGIIRDVQNGLSSTLLRLILENHVHPVYAGSFLPLKLIKGAAVPARGDAMGKQNQLA
jgi:hypothetical protein